MVALNLTRLSLSIAVGALLACSGVKTDPSSTVTSNSSSGGTWGSATGGTGGTPGTISQGGTSAVSSMVNCTHVAGSVLDALSTDACTVMIRVSTGSEITGYRIACAARTTTTETDALNQLLPMSSINWSGAKSIIEASTGLYVFATSDNTYEYLAYFSRDTGKLLTMVQNSKVASAEGRFRMETVWGSGAELGSMCEPGAVTPTLAYVNTFQMPLSAIQAIMRTDIMRALHEKNLAVERFAVDMIDAAGPEYLFFLSTRQGG